MRVLLVPDVPNWAWDFKADALIKCLGDTFDFSKNYTNRFNKAWLKEYDSIHFFGWVDSISVASFVTTGISSQNFENQIDKAKSIMPKFKAITTVSRIILDKAKKLRLNDNLYLCENGVDLEMFQPDKENVKNDKLIIGWVGQAGGNFDQHGYKSILQPLKAMINGRKDMEVRVIGNNWKNAISRSEMIKFYHSIDVLIHTGHMTGTPNPIFEAAACGKAVMSTIVGASPDMIKDGENGFLIQPYHLGDRIVMQRVIDEFMKKLLLLVKDRELCGVFGNKSREIVEKDWGWKVKAKQWIPVFRNYQI